MSVTALHVANYFLSQTDEEAGDLISNLKLQKLVYYAQGFHVAMFEKTALFPDQIEAWTHGPVVDSLYHEFKTFGAGPIPRPVDFDSEIFSTEQRELLDEVYKVYGQFSAWKLRNLTHEEPPYQEGLKSLGRIISLDSLYRYFSTQLVGLEEA
ncbi:MAG TPA: type II toxin-antitoxin system antitoxin SocA domain-containing protein [Pyrinomonadaceae bacterium]|nr:type II toxin-antitoxin system antitoxin SocA domain-containing protein [Pyrinomonadaceae bacterium]